MLIKNDVHLALARGEATAVVLLYQSPVFDMTDMGTFLDCLSSWFGVYGGGLDWFKSYLSDQCVKIGSILSDSKKLLFGVPQQDPVLGPILFSLCTTPLSKVIQNHPSIGFHFYADNSQLYVHLTHKRVHGGRVVTLSPPTSEAGVRSPARPQVGKLVVACCWSAVYSTEP